jgi:hypothetical protein
VLRRLSIYPACTHFPVFFSFSDDEYSVTSLGESSHGVSALEKLLAYDRAASLIQRQFRYMLSRRASALSGLDGMKDHMMKAASIIGIGMAALGFSALQRDLPVIIEGSEHSYEGEEQEKLDFTETTDHEDGEDLKEHTEEEEAAEEPKPRSGKYLWGVTAAAVGFLAPKMLSAMMGGGSPVDEDDALSAAMLVQGSQGSAGASAGAGAGGSAGATSAATATTATTATATSAATSAVQ